jgi:hypothetical protein
MNMILRDTRKVVTTRSTPQALPNILISFKSPHLFNSSHTYMPHINHHCTRSIPLQHTHAHNIIQPRIRPIPPRLKLPPQHSPPIRQRESLSHDNYVGAVVGPNSIARIRTNNALCISQSPIRADVKDRACGVVLVCGYLMWGSIVG